MSEAIIELDFEIPGAEHRTRAEDELGNTDIYSLWVGVYDIETGNRVGSSFNSTSGLSTGTVTVPVIYYDTHPEVVIVGVANYDVHDKIFKDWDGNLIESSLTEADTWDKFLDINVKCPTTEDGVPSPVTGYNQIMMGLLTAPESKRPLLFKSNNGGVGIENATGIEVNLASSLYGPMTKTITGKKIYLQRLYSQVNVRIVAQDNAEVTKVSYRMGNIPKAVFLAERPTYTTKTKNWNPWIAGTPNFADTKLSPNGTNNIATGDSYYTEETWHTGDRDNTFKFYHYENKHWGWIEDGASLPYPDPADQYYLNREDLTDNKIPTLLGNGYNYYASYFVVRMTILDRRRNTSAMVDYVIHEGNCNDSKGESSPNNIWDYCSFRNMVYNYTLYVNGNGMVTYNVESKNSGDHHDGTSGIIWEAQIGTLYTADSEGPRDPYGFFNLPEGHKDNMVYRFYQGRGVNQPPLDRIYGPFSDNKEEAMQKLLNMNLNGMYWPTIDDNTKIEPVSNCDIIEGLFWFKYDNDNNDKPGWPFDFFPFAKKNPGTYVVCLGPATKNPQWDPDAYKVGFYYYDSHEESSMSGTDKDNCTNYTGKVCHVYEWKPAQKQKEQLYLDTNNSQIPTETEVINFVTQNVELDFSNVNYRTRSNSDVSKSDYALHVKVNGNEYPLDSNYKCYIPISSIGTSNSYSVYAESRNSLEFSDSGETTIKNAFSFTNPSWNFDAIYNDNPSLDLKNGYDFGYLMLIDGQNGCNFAQERKFGDSNKGERGIAMGGKGSATQRYFQLKVYSSCKIKVSYWANSDDTRKVTINVDGNLTTDSTGSNKTKSTKQVFETYINVTDESLVKIYSTDGDMYFYEISLSN